jgi:hypothetical protein
MMELSNAAIGQAASKGLRVKRIIFSDQKRWDGRSVVIEDKPCQIVRTRYCVSKPGSPKALSIPLYLPRTDWPDFVIYVVRRPPNGLLEFYIVPRGALSKDTELCPSTLERYRDAWGLLKETLSPDLVERRFADLNWQLRNAIAAAKRAGLEVSLIPLRHNRPWPLFVQTKVIIADRKCTLHSLSRINSDPSQNEHAYVALRKQKTAWAEFQLYVLPDLKEPVVYVIPSASIKADTSVSLKNERLAFYRNKWSLLTKSEAEPTKIDWGNHSHKRINRRALLLRGVSSVNRVNPS